MTILEVITKYLYDLGDGIDNMTSAQVAEGIVALPEMVEMRAIVKHHKVLQEAFPEWAFSSNTLEPFKTWKEKAKQYDQLPIDDEGSMYSQKNLDRLQEWKEKAEKWDKWTKIISWPDVPQEATFDDVVENISKKVSNLDLLMSDLWVRETKENPITGATCRHITVTERPATPEEVRELIENCFKSNHWKKWNNYTSGFMFLTLKSGATLFMKEEK